MIKLGRKLWEDFKEYIVLTVLLLISLYFISISEHESTKNFRAFVFGVFASVTSGISDIANISDVKSENIRLRRKNAELMLEVQMLREYGIANQQLKRLIGLEEKYSYKLYPAVVMSKSTSASQSNFTINIGEDEGVKPGMPVVNDAGLVGIVYSVSGGHSIVRTLMNINLSIMVKDQRSRESGILKWNGESLRVTNLSMTADVEIGDRIFTSELSSIIGISLPIGVVKDILNPRESIFKELVVQPFVDFTTTEYVFVVDYVESKVIDSIEVNFYRAQE